ncbi:transposase IS4 domain-containing protein [Phthorimaea operculella]|nr:transposase IS4 domain-containing protein [Phthorimaea operculella]
MGSSSEDDSWSTMESSYCFGSSGSECECSTCSSSDDADCSYKRESEATPLGDRTNKAEAVRKPAFGRKAEFTLKEKAENDLEENFVESDDEALMLDPMYRSSSSCSSGSEEEEYEQEEWTATDTRRNFPFTATPVMNTGAAETPLDFFYLLFNRDFVQFLADQINARGQEIAEEENKVLTPTDVEEVYTLLSTHFMMGFSGCIAEDIMFGHRPSLNIDFNTYIRKERYILLFNLLAHKTLEKECREDYRLWYEVAKPIADKFNSLMKTLMVPGKDLELEKATVLYFNEANAFRRRQDRVRMHLLSDENRIFQRVFLVDPELQEEVRGEKIAKTLMEDFLDTGRSLFTSSFYTSVTLAEELLERKTHLTGVLKKNRMRNPAFLKYSVKTTKMPVRVHVQNIQTKNKNKPVKIIPASAKEVHIAHGYNKKGVCVVKIVRPMMKFNMLSTEFDAKPATDPLWECELIEKMYERSNTFKRDKQLSKCGPNLSIRDNRHVAYLLQAMLMNAYLMFKVKTGRKMKFVSFLEEVLYQMLPLEAKDKENVTGKKKPSKRRDRGAENDGPDECVI